MVNFRSPNRNTFI